MPRDKLPGLMLDMALLVSGLSTCSRLAVGSVVTDPSMETILGYGYNGNAMGLPNQCDSAEPGACGCVHSEANALIKAGRGEKAMFITATPCVPCAKLIINAGVKTVWASSWYRVTSGAETLLRGGVLLFIPDGTGGFKGMVEMREHA